MIINPDKMMKVVKWNIEMVCTCVLWLFEYLNLQFHKIYIGKYIGLIFQVHLYTMLHVLLEYLCILFIFMNRVVRFELWKYIWSVIIFSMLTTTKLPANSDIFTFTFSKPKQVHTGDVIFIVANSIEEYYNYVHWILWLYEHQ